MAGEGGAAQQGTDAARELALTATELHVDRAGTVRVALDPYVSVLSLVTDALGRRRGAPQAWRKRILASLSPRSAGALHHVTTPHYSILPDSMTPMNPACEMAVGDQVERLYSISDHELLSDFYASCGRHAGQPWPDPRPAPPGQPV